MLLSSSAYADIRCCVEPGRYSDNRIIRSLSVIEDFKKLYPFKSSISINLQLPRNESFKFLTRPITSFISVSILEIIALPRNPLAPMTNIFNYDFESLNQLVTHQEVLDP